MAQEQSRVELKFDDDLQKPGFWRIGRTEGGNRTFFGFCFTRICSRLFRKPQIHQVLWDCAARHIVSSSSTLMQTPPHTYTQIYASTKCKVQSAPALLWYCHWAQNRKGQPLLARYNFFSKDNLVQNATFCKVHLFCCQVQPCANCTEANHQKRPCTLDEPSFAPFALVAKILHGRSMTVPYFQRKLNFVNISWAIPI